MKREDFEAHAGEQEKDFSPTLFTSNEEISGVEQLFEEFDADSTLKNFKKLVEHVAPLLNIEVLKVSEDGVVFKGEDVDGNISEYDQTLDDFCAALEAVLRASKDDLRNSSAEGSPEGEEEPDKKETNERRQPRLEDFKTNELSSGTQQALVYFFNSLRDFRVLNNETKVPEVFKIALKEMGIDIEPGTLQGRYVLRQEQGGNTLVVTRMPGAVANFLVSKIDKRLIVPKYMRGKDVTGTHSGVNQFTGRKFGNIRRWQQEEQDRFAGVGDENKEQEYTAKVHINEEAEAPPDADVNTESDSVDDSGAQENGEDGFVGEEQSGHPEQTDHEKEAEEKTTEGTGERAERAERNDERQEEDRNTGGAGPSQEKPSSEKTSPNTGSPEGQNTDKESGNTENAKSESAADTGPGRQESEQPRSSRGSSNSQEGARSAEQGARSTSESESAPRGFDTRFESEFGITEEELRGVKGFERLSLPQQKLVFENLKEYAERGTEGYLAHVWTGIKSAFGNKGEGVPRQGSRGMESYGKTLAMLIYSADTFGPKVHEEGGKLYADFVGMTFDREHRKEQKEVVDALNEAAHTFARTPASWQEGMGVKQYAPEDKPVGWKFVSFMKDGLFGNGNRKDKNEYSARSQAFENAKKNFATQLEATGVPQAEIVKKLIDIDSQVYNMRFVETNPEAAQVLGEIQDESMWQNIGNKIVAGSIYGAFGAVGRLALGQAAGFLGAPLVAASLAGVRTWNRTAAEQRERDRKARMGSADGSDGALNIVIASQKVEIAGKMREVGITQKLEDVLKGYRDVDAALKSAKEQRDPEAVSKLEVQRAKEFERLTARATYSYDKLKLNRIQFGDSTSFGVNQAKFFETLAAAQVAIAEEKIDATTGNKLEDRLEKILNVREGAINDRRRKEQVKKIVIASSTAAAMSFAGALAADEFKTSGMGERIRSWFGNTPNAPVASGQGGGAGVPASRVVEVGGRASASMPNAAETGVRLPEGYAIKKGDTLLKIITEKNPFPNSTTGEPLTQGEALRALRSLSKDELARVGIRSGNIDLIYADEKLNLAELQKLMREHGNGIPTSVAREDIGDFRGAKFEKDSDILNKASTIREMEIPNPSTLSDAIVNEYPSGGSPEVGPTPSEAPPIVAESVDPVTLQKAKILEQYFLKTNIEPEMWGRMRTGTALSWKDYKHPLRGPIPEHVLLVKKIFTAVESYPLKLVPEKNETTENFMRRIFVKMAEMDKSITYPLALKKLFNKVV